MPSRGGAVWCACGHVAHVLANCEYVEDYEMIAAVGGAMQSEPEETQQRWLRAHNVGEKVSAVVSMEVKGVSPDALREIGLAVKTMVGKAEAKLAAVNEACESWPMVLELWVPDEVGPQLEALDVVLPGSSTHTGTAG